MSDAPDQGIVGAILAGGAGSRMGGQKAAVLLAGRPLAAWTADAMRAHVRALAVVGDGASSIGAVSLEDLPGAAQGPLAGVAAALSWARAQKAEWLVTAPCDTPFLPPDAVSLLVERARERAGVAFARTQDGKHPLIAAWRSSLASDVAARLRAGVHPPVHRLMDDLQAAAVWFGDPAAFLNVNTPEDLARAEALIAQRATPSPR